MGSSYMEGSRKTLQFVYKLIDPRTGSVAYIGITGNPNRRYLAHLDDTKANDRKNAWIEQLRSEHLEPRMEIIETLETREEALEREKYWIQWYLQQGVTLVNVVSRPKKFVPDKMHECQWPADLPKLILPAERVERRDAREHRQRILEVARRLFAEHGVEAVSMHQIAVAAGIGQGTLYRRYARKGDLCIDLLQEQHQQFVEEIAAFFFTTQESPALERLKGVLARCIEFLEEQGPLLDPIVQCELIAPAEKGHFPDPHRFGFSFFNWLYEVFASLLGDAVERGELLSLDVPYTAHTITANLLPPFYHFLRQERGISPERMLEGLCHIYIDGLQTR